jgi:hypothetical protein
MQLRKVRIKASDLVMSIKSGSAAEKKSTKVHSEGSERVEDMSEK